MHRTTTRTSEGQIIVVFAGAIIALIIAVGLVVDVGLAWSKQRDTQNAADAAAKAGALILARRAAEGSTSPTTDQDVRNAVLGSAAANRVTLEAAVYTDWQGNDLRIGVGSIGAAAPPSSAAGVRAVARQVAGTFLIRVIGQNNWRIIQEATAVSGPTTGCVDTEEGCTVLPVAFPVNVFGCTNTGKSDPIEPPQGWDVGQQITLPLCGGNPGSVGWLDWTPPGGGASEVEEVILQPPPVNIPLPSWNYVTETGDISSAPVEDALNTYAGEVVLVPMFADTCPDEPPNLRTSDCPAGSGGTGVNQWYWITQFLAFKLDLPRGAWINGSNEDVCGANAKECLKGSFVKFITQGTVGAPCPPEGCPVGTAFSVQLIK